MRCGNKPVGNAAVAEQQPQGEGNNVCTHRQETHNKPQFHIQDKHQQTATGPQRLREVRLCPEYLKRGTQEAEGTLQQACSHRHKVTG